MNMRDHILSALSEQFNRWEEYLAGLGETDAATPLQSTDWSAKDVVAHLMAWQKRSLARLEAARADREPDFPEWLPDVNPDGDGSPDETNAWIYAAYHDQTWPTIYQEWRAGFLRLIELGRQVSERDLLDSGRYPWMVGYSLADVLLGTYDHHQEHNEIVSELR
jgi:hypothetical protein